MNKWIIGIATLILGGLLGVGLLMMVDSDDSQNADTASTVAEDATIQIQQSVHSTARDSERRTDLNAVSGHLESYFARHGYYPKQGEFSTQWVADNMPGLDSEALLDPSSDEYYVYTATPENCDNVTLNCSGFTLSADLENDGRGDEDADGNTADQVQTSQN